MSAPPPLALTMGEPAGVGGEIAIKAWAVRREVGVPPFFLIDDPGRLQDLAGKIGVPAAVRPIVGPDEAPEMFGYALPVLPVLPGALSRAVTPGQPDPLTAPAVVASIDRAVDLVLGGQAAAVVTNPIQKVTLYRGGFTYPGHTEYLAARSGVDGADGGGTAMMLITGDLRVVPVTIHLPLKDAIAALTTEAIVRCGRLTAQSLARDFGIATPSVAIAALNPHAGEAGALGREEAEIIEPAVAQLAADGIAATGPWPADTLFHAAARARHDAVVCMYHDQALIPIKTIDFHHGVNITLGLPFVRTSPDHGTALDIAGTGRANPSSLIAALKAASAIASRHAAAASA